MKAFGDGQGGVRRIDCATALDAGMDAPSRARAFVRDQVAAARLPEDVLADLLVIVSELVSNAVQHGAGDPRLELRVRGTRVRVDVGDEAVDAPPMLRPHDRTASRGRGLGIISAVADQWGHEVRGGAKWIWAELDRAEGRAVSAEPVA
ncbi:MAG: ATP-binding protein [Marmoricola sp.]